MSFEGKRLLILGANPETAGLVKKANSMGLYTIVTDYQHGAYAKRFASKSYDINAIDVRQVIELAKTENVDGVMVGVAESLLPTYQKVCEALGIPCYATEEQIEVLINKANFKNLCREYDVPVVPEYDISIDSTDKELSDIEYPVVVKPVDSCSSKGIYVCNNIKELKWGIRNALSYSNSKKLIIEKYMTGDEVVIYYTFQNGNPIFTAMCDRYTNKEQKGVAQLPTSYIYPSRYIERYQELVDHKVKKMFKGLSLKNGTMFIQSFIENGEVRFYEPGYRLNGAQEHIIVSAITGIDVQEMMIRFALTGQMSDSDIEENSDPKFRKWGCKLSPLVKEGEIHTLSGFQEIEEIPEVISINPSYEQGDIVKGIGTLKQIIARFYIVTDNLEKMSEVIDLIHDKLVVLNKNEESLLLQIFDTRILRQNYLEEK